MFSRRIFGLAGIALAALAALSGACDGRTLHKRAGGGSSAAAGPMRAFDFYSKFGVNGALDKGHDIYTQISQMYYTGIKNIRTSAYNKSTQESIDQFQFFSIMTAQNIKQHFATQSSIVGTSEQFGAMSDWVSALKTYIVAPYGTGMVTGVGGPNEPDVTPFFYAGLGGIAAANAAQHDLFVTMRLDPTLNGIPVTSTPYAFPASWSSVGDHTADCDQVDIHDYYFVDNTGGQSYVGTIPVAMQGYLADARHMCNRVPFITTETGYGSTVCGGCNQTASQDTQTRLIFVDMFDHARNPDLKYVYLFTLMWGPSSGNWGVFNDDWSPKPSATALRYLSAILNDPGATAATFTSTAFVPTLSGMPAAGSSFVLAKSDGSYLILLYTEAKIWDVATATPVSLSNSTVTVTLPSAMSGQVYNPIVNGVTPVQTITSQTSFNVTLNDAALIIAVGPTAPPVAVVPKPDIGLIGTPASGTGTDGNTTATVSTTLVGGGSLLVLTATACEDTNCVVTANPTATITDGTQTCVPATGAANTSGVFMVAMWYCKNNTRVGAATFTATFAISRCRSGRLQL
jgi:hypothetical protein